MSLVTQITKYFAPRRASRAAAASDGESVSDEQAFTVVLTCMSVVVAAASVAETDGTDRVDDGTDALPMAVLLRVLIDSGVVDWWIEVEDAPSDSDESRSDSDACSEDAELLEAHAQGASMAPSLNHVKITTKHGEIVRDPLFLLSNYTLGAGSIRHHTDSFQVVNGSTVDKLEAEVKTNYEVFEFLRQRAVTGVSSYPEHIKSKSAKANFRRKIANYRLSEDKERLFYQVHVLKHSEEEQWVPVPLDAQSFFDTAALIHFHPILGTHDGRDRTMSKAKRYYHCRVWSETVDSILKHCTVCQRVKVTPAIKAPTVSIITSRPGEKFVMDFSDFGVEGKEPHHRYILLVVDHFTKFVWGKSFPTKHAAPVAEWLYTTIYCNEMRPEAVLSDNGGEFINDILKEVNRLMNVKTTTGRPYHPQTQGVVERMNKTIKSKVLFILQTIIVLPDRSGNDDVFFFSSPSVAAGSIRH